MAAEMGRALWWARRVWGAQWAKLIEMCPQPSLVPQTSNPQVEDPDDDDEDEPMA